MIRIYLQRETTLDRFHEKYAVQLNDTHPALSVAELMRLLVDEHDYEWEQAWAITTKALAYTNHTLLPEALETWPLALFRRVLPRHLEIIVEINRRFLEEVRTRFPNEESRFSRMSLIDDAGQKSVRMANLACVGSHAINGVAELHTELLKTTVLSDFAQLYPERFSNKTNGVTQRRFVLEANPRLAALLHDAIGDGWVRDLTQLRGVEKLADDAAFVEKYRAARRENKRVLAAHIRTVCDIDVDPDSIFDIQVKRIHEYKRQHLNVLHAIALYRRIKEGRTAGLLPRTIIFGGKAAPGYHLAKLMIRLIHDVGNVINRDPDARELLRVVFIPDFNVKNAQRIYPAADLSEQISTAGKEASGTGNMKFAMNGALTIGTLDGANVEIREEVGAENFFLFGLTAEQVVRRKREGYHPAEVYERNPVLRQAIELIDAGTFSAGDKDRYTAITGPLLERDDYMLCADFPSYLETQNLVMATYAAPSRWWRMAVLNTARTGKFSSDRSVKEYCEDIWRVSPVAVEDELRF
jgi:starch phosphorylase